MRLEKRGTHRGFEYAILVHPFGFKNGYLKIPQGHSWYGKHYDELNEYISVHGGLTFSGHLDDSHILGEGYWVGFDCAHCFDLFDPDEMDKDVRKNLGKILSNVYNLPESKIRNTGYVEAQCKNLAQDCFDVSQLIIIERDLK